MTLVGEAGGRGDLRQARRAAPQEPAGSIETAAPEIFAGRHAEALPETAREIDRMHPELAGDLAHRPRPFFETGVVEKLARPAEPGGSTALRRAGLGAGPLKELEAEGLGDAR